MIRSELIEALAAQYPKLANRDIEESVGIILDGIANTLSRNGRVELRGFGVFTTTYRPARIGRNPKSGDRVMVPAKGAPRFKPGAALRKRVF